MRACSVDWCDRKYFANGYCSTHDRRAKRGVDMDAPIGAWRAAGTVEWPAGAVKCSIAVCDRPCKANGYCGQHDRRSKSGLEMDTPIGRTRPPCGVEGCGKPNASGGYCGGHLKRVQVHGDPLADKPLRPLTYYDHITSQVAHKNVHALRGKASEHLCADCGGRAKDWAYTGEDPDQMYGLSKGGHGRDTYLFYSVDPSFYVPLCRKCHGKRDGLARAKELREYRTLKHATKLTFQEIAEKLGVPELGEPNG